MTKQRDIASLTNLHQVGDYSTTVTSTATTSVTLPTSGTLATDTQVTAAINDALAFSIALG